MSSNVERRDDEATPQGPEQLGLPVLGSFIRESLDGIAVLDANLHVLYMNEAGCEILGVPSDALVGETGLVAVPPRRREAVGQILREMLRGTVIGLYKTELVRNKGPWRGLDDVEIATLEWVDWWNHRRLLEPIGRIPPAEAESAYYSR